MRDAITEVTSPDKERAGSAAGRRAVSHGSGARLERGWGSGVSDTRIGDVSYQRMAGLPSWATFILNDLILQ